MSLSPIHHVFISARRHRASASYTHILSDLRHCVYEMCYCNLWCSLDIPKARPAAQGGASELLKWRCELKPDK